MLRVKNFSFNSKSLNQNLKKTKKVFELFRRDFRDFNIPLLKSYNKSYKLDFSPALIKKFSKYDNIIIFGMGGSILATKCIYTFFGTKKHAHLNKSRWGVVSVELS